MDHFHLTPEQISKLTSYQINSLYFAKRKKTGELKEPPPEKEKPLKRGQTPPLPPPPTIKTRKQEYFECFESLFNSMQRKMITEEEFKVRIPELQLKFGRDKKDKLPSNCRKCEFLDLCNGECPKNRIIFTPEGEPGLNYLCEGFKMFYSHVGPYMDFMANELTHDRAASNVMKWARSKGDNL